MAQKPAIVRPPRDEVIALRQIGDVFKIANAEAKKIFNKLSPSEKKKWTENAAARAKKKPLPFPLLAEATAQKLDISIPTPKHITQPKTAIADPEKAAKRPRGRPRKTDESKKALFNIRLDESDLAELKELAARNGESVALEIRQAIKKHLAENRE